MNGDQIDVAMGIGKQKPQRLYNAMAVRYGSK